MNNNNNFVLTADQQKAADKFLGFLLSDEKEFFLFGAAGCGKTFLVKYLINHCLKEYKTMCQVLGKKAHGWNVYLTAPTNKAVEVLDAVAQDITRDVGICTIHSLLNIKVYDDYATGLTKLQYPKEFPYIDKGFVVVDECSMLSKELIEVLRENTSATTKILYVGDNFQLAPVNEKPVWMETPEERTAVLSIPVRNKDQKALIDLCAQLKETVHTKVFKPIKLVPNVIELLDDEKALSWLNSTDFSKNRILAYTNNKAIKYIKLIEQNKQQSEFIRLNNYYINTTHYNVPHKRCSYYPDELVQITQLSPAYQDYKLGGIECIPATISSVKNPGKKFKVVIAKDPQELKMKIKQQSIRKNWYLYFKLKNEVMDLRFPYASTIHKSQGSTFDEVLIDLGSFRVCDDPETAARLLYVAVSRAKNKVFFYGKLPKKYGELV